MQVQISRRYWRAVQTYGPLLDISRGQTTVFLPGLAKNRGLSPVFFICGLVLVEQATKIFIIRRVVGEYNLGTGAI